MTRKAFTYYMTNPGEEDLDARRNAEAIEAHALAAGYSTDKKVMVSEYMTAETLIDIAKMLEAEVLYTDRFSRLAKTMGDFHRLMVDLTNAGIGVVTIENGTYTWVKR